MTGKELTHIDAQGHARMVDVSAKAATLRIAVARATVRLRPEVLELIAQGGLPKGDVLAVARVAGIQAAKRTWELIPMCHQVTLTGIDIHFETDTEHTGLHIEAAARCKGETGVEMEALTAASVAALTIYDMCKAVQRDITIEAVRLVEKSGGASGDWRMEES